MHILIVVTGEKAVLNRCVVSMAGCESCIYVFDINPNTRMSSNLNVDECIVVKFHQG
jgi:hypothetical protein